MEESIIGGYLLASRSVPRLRRTCHICSANRERRSGAVARIIPIAAVGSMAFDWPFILRTAASGPNDRILVNTAFSSRTEFYELLHPPSKPYAAGFLFPAC